MDNSTRFIFLVFIFFASIQVTYAQQKKKIENVIILTTDGFRWQEVFNGIDTALATRSDYNQEDGLELLKKYWANDTSERREKLLPFLWGTVAKKGQLYGNRNYGNKVDNANPYWFSYPGYSEFFCGYVDTLVNSNSYGNNPNTTLLEFLNHQKDYNNQVAAFGAWEAFNRILNEENCGFPVVAAFDSCGGKTPDANQRLINAMLKDSYKPFGEDECLDVFTQYEALEYLQTKKPKVFYVSYGETDEWAHDHRYRDYLNAANRFDEYARQIWNFIQHDPQYKDKTALFVTVDHGRGDKTKSEWTSHGQKIEDSHEIWFGLMGPGIPGKGEVKADMQIYQKQFAQTIASLLGFTFTAEHPVAKKIDVMD